MRIGRIGWFLGLTLAVSAAGGLFAQSTNTGQVYQDAQNSAQAALQSAQGVAKDTSNATAKQNQNFSTNPYQGQVTPSSMATPGALANAGLQQDTYQQLLTAQQSQVQFNPADMKSLVTSSNQVANNPSQYVAIDASGQQVACQPVPPGQAAATQYTATCNTGSAVTTTTPSCVVPNVPQFSTTYTYSCNQIRSSDRGPAGLLGGACGAYLAAGCKMTFTGNGALSEAAMMQGAAINANFSAQCTAPVQGTLSGPADIAGVPVAFALTGETSTYTGSASDTSACARYEPQCPASYVLSAGTCVRTTAATSAYTCPNGWTLSGSTCMISHVARSIYQACPNGYTLIGNNCVSVETQAAQLVYSCPSGSMLSGSNCLDYATPTGGNASCSVPVVTCTDGSPATRTVNGVAVTQACWAWTRTYSCSTVTSGNSTCGALAANANCSLTSTECLDDPATPGACQVANEIYTCSVPGKASTAPTFVCSSGIYCVDGSCQQVAAQPSQDFTKAVAALSTIGTVQNELDPNSITLFEGTANGCHKPLFGIENCCAGGPGIPLIGACSADERALASDFSKGITHYVGTFCSSSILGICISEHETFCVFQSKLGRLIQEQGRAQLNMDFGTAQNPVCTGLTPAQFAQLDLSKMDFTAVMNDLTSDVTIPDETSTLSTMQKKIQAYYSNNTGS